MITLDVINGRMAVQDNGPGIPARDRETVFERGFTRKPGGRGLGLFISRQSLRKDGFDLEILPTKRGTAFAIVEQTAK